MTESVMPDVIDDDRIEVKHQCLFIEPMDNLILSALKICAVSAAQLVIFVACYEAVVDVYLARFGAMNKVFGFDMQMDLSLYLLSILSGVNSLGHLLFSRVQHRLIVTVVCTAVWISFWGNILDVVPNRFALLTVLGMVSFLAAAALTARRAATSFS